MAGADGPGPAHPAGSGSREGGRENRKIWNGGRFRCRAASPEPRDGRVQLGGARGAGTRGHLSTQRHRAMGGPARAERAGQCHVRGKQACGEMPRSRLTCVSMKTSLCCMTSWRMPMSCHLLQGTMDSSFAMRHMYCTITSPLLTVVLPCLSPPCSLHALPHAPPRRSPDDLVHV